MIWEAILKTSELSSLSQVAGYLVGKGLEGPGRHTGFKGRGSGTFRILVHVWPGTTLCLGALLPCFGAMVPQLPVWVGPGVAWSVPSRAIGAWLSLPRFQRTGPPSSYRFGTPALEIWMEEPRQRNTMGVGSSKDVGSGPNQSRE